jgi:23S rRNA (cytosine1962-C5)-methyltransferase
MNARDSVEKAFAKRAALRASGDTHAYRLVNGAADGLRDVTVDLFGPVAVLSLYDERLSLEVNALAEAVAQVAGVESVYLKKRPRSAQHAGARLSTLSPDQPLWGSPQPEVWVKERGLSFLIRPAQGLSVGLYLDSREARVLVERLSPGARVLNLFAYTCGFGLAAWRGGAARVLNVDLSRKVLAWGESNATNNRLPARPADFVAGDAFEWLKRLRRREEEFDLVVVDPPSFSSSKAGVFSAERDFARLAAASLELLSERGRLLCLCNQASLTPPVFEGQILQAVQKTGRTVVQRESGGPLLDFPSQPGEAAPLKTLLLQVTKHA